MTILNRFIKLCKADIHGVMDEIEDRGLLLKQCLRDMETSLTDKKARLDQLTASRAQAEKEFEIRQGELEKLEADVTAAIGKERDDIARLLIKKVNRLRRHQLAMQRHLTAVAEDISRLQDTIDSQQQELATIKLQAATFFHCREMEPGINSAAVGWLSDTAPDPSEEEIELELLRRKDALRGGDL